MTSARAAALLPRAALLALAAATVAKLALAATTEGTNDVDAFRQFLRELLGSGAAALYRDDPSLNHPPFVLHLLLALRWIVNATGLPFAFWMRVPAILADVGSVWLAWRIVGERLETRPGRATLALAAAAPASVMISGFHGNTDPVMIFFVLLSLSWIERPGRLLLAGAAMGMAVNVKVVPLVFWPAVLLWLPGWRSRARYFGAAIAVVLAASTPILFQEPALVARNVLGYGSDHGVWGLGWATMRFREQLPLADALLRGYGRHLLVAVMIGLSAWMNRGGRRPPLFRQLGVIAFAFLALTPGFAVQYLAWLVPWVVGIPVAACAAFLATSGLLLILVYTAWCQGLPSRAFDSDWLHAAFWEHGLPWRQAHANLFALSEGGIVPVAIACWLAVVVVLVAQLRSLGQAPRQDASTARARLP